MDELARAWSFECAIQDRCARMRREFAHGTALYNDQLRRVYDTNFVRFERDFDELTGAVVEAAADELQASLRHRKVLIPDERAGALVAEELRERGWRHYMLVTMAYRGPRNRDDGDGDDGQPRPAEQVDPRAVRGAREQAHDAGRRDAEAHRQIIAFTELMATAVHARMYAAFTDGEVGSYCALFQEHGVGQIDEVTTVPRFQRRGLGTAVVEAALRASLADGDDLTFLVADESDWPHEWYARLGFEPVGRRYELLKV
jgi:ribosomal protein S18 acetylase RimI-like enzyme